MSGKVGPQSGGPMYHQLRQDLLGRIRRGEFVPNGQLPSENELRREYEVSATTVRRALLELAKEGIIRRKAGVGTMVSPQIRSRRITFVSIDYSGDAWRHLSSVMGELISGVGEYAWRHETTLNLIGVEGDEAATYLRSLTEERSSDGVLLRTADDVKEEHLDILEEAGFPYVVIKRHIPGRRMNCVISDDVSGAKMATSHLMNLGYRRVGFVCAKPHITLSQERLAGYEAALADNNLNVDKTLIRQEPYFTMESGYRAVRSLLEFPAARPDAILVASDTMALGGYQAVWDLGLEIPNDVALMGYDDIPQASVLQPPLTTMRTSFYDFGLMSAQLLSDIIDGREPAPQQRVIRPRLIIRGSTEKRESVSRFPPIRAKSNLEEANTGTDSARRGRLVGKVVAYTGMLTDPARAIRRMLEAEGASVVSEADMPQRLGHRGRADVLIHNLSLGRDLAADLDEATAYGRVVAKSMVERGLRTLVYVASWTHSEGPISRVRQEATRASLTYIVKVLAAEWRSKGLRVNGLVSPTSLSSSETGENSLGGLLVFLVSDEAEQMSGETLKLGDSEEPAP